MRISVWPAPSRTPAEVLDTARWADEHGWYGVWYADHYMPNSGTEEVLAGDTHECWAMLPAIAAVTSQVRVGSLVSPTSVHHPALLANRAATIDHLSNGRMVLGVGAGWQINEHRAYGIDLEAPKPRVDRFEEAITIMRSLLDDDVTTFDGDVYRIIEARSDPAPIQSPLPILVGTKSPRMLRITATHAQEWNTWGDLDGVRERHAAFVRACGQVDRDPASMWVSAQALVTLDDQPAGGMPGIGGSAEQIVDTLGRYASIGVDEFIVPDFNLGESPEQRHEVLARIHTEIVPHLP